MCVAIVVPKNACNLLRSEMSDANQVNSDGIGIAWAKSGKVHYRKGISIDEAMKLSETVPRPYVLHFRLATAGGTDYTMCHPFPVDRFAKPKLRGSAKEVLFHNGHVSDYREMLMDMLLSRNMRMPKGSISDTRVCALFAFRVGRDGLSLLNGNKFAVLNSQGKVETYGHWQKREGRLYSNTNHIWDAWSGTGYANGKAVVFTKEEKEEFARMDQRVIESSDIHDRARWGDSDYFQPTKTRKYIDKDQWKTLASEQARQENLSCDGHHAFVFGCIACENKNGLSVDAPEERLRDTKRKEITK